MTENQLYPGIITGANSEGWCLLKIVDGSVGKKPFDMFGLDELSRAVALEVKVWRQTTRMKKLPEQLFESQQLPWLRYYAKRGCTSLALIYDLTTKVMHVYDFKKEAFTGTLSGTLGTNWTGWHELMTIHIKNEEDC